MEKLNLQFFYQLGAQLGQLTKSVPSESNRIDILIATSSALNYINELMSSKSFATLSVCRAAGSKFMSAIADVQKWLRETPPEKWGEKNTMVDTKFAALISSAKEFETILCAELQTLGTYNVTQKGIYLTGGLVDNAENMLPDSIRLRFGQDVVYELRQSGRCLAFDVPTASAFHILRATEMILHDYYLNVCKPEKADRLESWGAYIKALSKSDDPNVKETVAILQQIKDNDRNLIMHPERVLSSDDAFILFEITKGAIMAMSVKLTSRSNTTPPAGAIGVDITATLGWPAVPGVAGYEFVIAEDLGGTDKFAIIDYSTTTTTNSHTLRENLKFNTVYWWRVRWFNATAKGPWTVSFFTTRAQAVAPKQT